MTDHLLDQFLVISLGLTAWGFSISYVAGSVAETLRKEIEALMEAQKVVPPPVSDRKRRGKPGKEAV